MPAVAAHESRAECDAEGEPGRDRRGDRADVAERDVGEELDHEVIEDDAGGGVNKTPLWGRTPK